MSIDDSIEIRPCGAIYSKRLPIGTVSWETAYPAEYVGEWFLYDPQEEVLDRLKEVEAEADEYDTARDKAEMERDEAQEAEKAATDALTALQDEVRVYLIHGDHSPDAVARLKGALEASDG